MNKTLPELLREFNTTCYKEWKDIIQIKHYKTGLFHYFNVTTLEELPMTSIKNIFDTVSDGNK